MKHVILFLLFINQFSIIRSQDLNTELTPGPTRKKSIDTAILGKWPYVANPYINDEGDYVAFNILNYKIGKNDLVLKSTKTNWEKIVDLKNSNLYGCFLFSKNKQAVFKHGDTLSFVLLGKELVKNISHVSSFKYPVSKGGEWVAYGVQDSLRQLILLNLSTNKELKFEHVRDYTFEGNGKFLAIESEDINGVNVRKSLTLVKLSDLVKKTIWMAERSSHQVSNLSFDNEGSQLLFVVRDNRNLQHSAEVWHFRDGDEKAELKIQNNSEGIMPDCYISGIPRFSKNGKYILFNLHKEIKRDSLGPVTSDVNVWSYKDSILQPEQMRREGMVPSDLRNDYHSLSLVYNFTSNKIIQLTNEDEDILSVELKGDYAVLMDNKSITEFWWSFNSQPSFYIISLIDGTKNLLKKNGGRNALNNFSFSPENKYLIYWDKDSAGYLIYNIKTNTSQNITKSINSRFDQEDINEVDIKAAAEIAGWDINGEQVYIYDNYDLWRIDLAHNYEAINITNGYGKKNNIKFRITNNGSLFNDELLFSSTLNNELLLSAFNTVTKENGFYKIRNNTRNDPMLLTIGPYVYYRAKSLMPPAFYPFNGFDMAPIKARNANCWIVKKQTVADAPNFYFTKDFKSFKPVSRVSPQSNNFWLRSELITCQQPNGVITQAILYKPENFDPHKKYPVIFNYYEKMSYRLNEYPYPFWTTDQINIPWFVSNGYLVCTPDISYSIAKVSGISVGENALNAIVAVAKYLSGLSYIDDKKMALQGHSFAGLETNYLVTHSNLFAAAAEVAGETDPISRYLTLTPFVSSLEHSSTQSSRERGHELYGCTPWERPELYRRNSAVLNADKVTTPLLITHNPKDNQVQWRQGVELYLALRRLGKPVWMLQYNNSSHSLSGNDARDYTIRLTQFFDHYLKGTSAPKWMTKGIPANLKGVESGYELDSVGSLQK